VGIPAEVCRSAQELRHGKPMQQIPKIRAVLRKRTLLLDRALQKSSLHTTPRVLFKQKKKGNKKPLKLRGKTYRKYGKGAEAISFAVSFVCHSQTSFLQ